MQGIEHVRIAGLKDAKAISEIYAPYVRDTVISFEYMPPDEAEMAARIAKVLMRLPWLVFEEQGEVLGYAYASPHRERAAYQWAVDAGIYIGPKAHRRGVGRALYAVLFAALTRQGYHRAYGGITLPNAASIGLHEACGFKPIGTYPEVGFKFGKWHGVGWWGLDLSASVAPEPPLHFTPEIFEAAKASLKADASGSS
ncbi:MAG: N-acetyltransferase family protein [Parvibaculum sp.]|nr:N-acetyltransferase family protein [Parvibaculum sp.]